MWGVDCSKRLKLAISHHKIKKISPNQQHKASRGAKRSMQIGRKSLFYDKIQLIKKFLKKITEFFL